MSQKLLCAIGIFVLLASVSKVNSVERLSTEELVSHCEFSPEQAAGVDGQFCIHYVQGFIDGPMATDERMLLNIEAKLDKTETYLGRAALVHGASLPDRAAQYAEFRLDEPESLQKVVGHVVDDLKATSFAADAMARAVVYASLRKNYPCESNS
jgi:hypothetical protein